LGIRIRRRRRRHCQHIALGGCIRRVRLARLGGGGGGGSLIFDSLLLLLYFLDVRLAQDIDSEIEDQHDAHHYRSDPGHLLGHPFVLGTAMDARYERRAVRVRQTSNTASLQELWVEHRR